jgi:geranylgeranyl transferase type-2 subunit beta
MSLVSGPGRGGGKDLPQDLKLFVDKHVKYIQSLDSVRPLATDDAVPN